MPCYPGPKSARTAARLMYPKVRRIPFRCGAYWHVESRESLPALSSSRPRGRRRESLPALSSSRPRGRRRERMAW